MDRSVKSYNQLRYPFAIYLKGDLKRKVRNLQKKSYLLTGSRASLDFWEPHITIAPPVYLKKEDLKEIFNVVKSAIQNIKPFKVRILGFNFYSDNDSYNNSNVISLKIVSNKELIRLTKKLVKSLKNKYKHDYYFPEEYKYHITISYRDLSEEGFKKAKKYFKEIVFKEAFLVDHVAIGKENKNKKVEEINRFTLN